MPELLSIRKRKVTVGGARVNYYEVVEPDIVTVIPVLDDGSIVMERQYRPIIGKYVYEVPAGHVDRGETPSKAAARELEEETGYKAGSLKLVLRTYHATGSSRTVNNYFIAKRLRKGHVHRDAHEVMSIRKLKPSAAVKLILNEKGIRDTKTVIAVLFLLWKRLI